MTCRDGGVGGGLPIEERHCKECLLNCQLLTYLMDVGEGGWHTATYVPGRKSVVSTAMIFIAEESCLLAAASSLESLASPILIWVSAWVMRLNN